MTSKRRSHFDPSMLNPVVKGRTFTDTDSKDAAPTVGQTKRRQGSFKVFSRPQHEEIWVSTLPDKQ